MRRTRLARFLGAAMLAALVLPQAALATPGTATKANADLAPIKLGCALVVPNPLASAAPNRAIVCRWSAPDGVAIRAFRLWRSVDAAPRRLAATIPAADALRHADRNIRSGHTYHYRVIGLAADGTRVARSARVTVHVGRQAETLRLGCAVVIDAGHRGVACHWSDAARPAAVRYVLYRSVDGGPREAVYRTGEDGRRRYLDTDVKAGQVVRYAVVALNAHNRIVSFGGPDRVRIPNGFVPAT